MSIVRVRRLAAGVIVLLLAVPTAATAKKPPIPKPQKFSLLLLQVKATMSGQLSMQASNDCGSHYCAPDGEFLNGSANVGFSSEVEWNDMPLVLSGSVPGLPAPEGLQSVGDNVTGSWSASGQDYEGDMSPPQSFTCSGSVGENVSSTNQYLFDHPQPNGDHVFNLSLAGTPQANGSDCDFPGVTGDLMGGTYYNDNTTATGPFSGQITITKAEWSLPMITKTITPTQASLPGSDCTALGNSWVVADHCSSSFKWTGTVKIFPHCEHISTGSGYNQLSGTMKADLAVMYAKLKADHGCWHFTIGYRNTSVQKDIYDRWHAIADNSADNPDVCTDLNAAHFKQCPEGYNPDGTAKGGPAVPGTSRHEKGQAADITVTFLPSGKEDLGRYQAAAKAAGLCGPPAKDAVHVELPYAKGKQKEPSCHFG